MPDLDLRYYFDPLCGWCYASAAALAALVDRHGDALRMMPVGLFAASQPISAIADHAWRNDQRIATLTGQRFSDAYRRDVLQAPDGVFTSLVPTRALVALGEIAPSLEPRFLHAAQLARYVDGRDTSRVDDVVSVAETVMSEFGGAFDAVAFADRLRNDQALAQRVEARMSTARAELPGGGVPQLLLHIGGRTHSVSGQTLYAGGDATLSAVERLSRAA